MDLRAFVLRFECRAETEIATPVFKGSMLRGALFATLRRDYCVDRQAAECARCQAWPACPVSSLLATMDEDGARGSQVARPCTVEPPLESRTRYGPGDPLSFGVTLFGDAADLLPYVILGVRRLGETGLGSRNRAPGRFVMERIEAIDPVAGESQEVYSSGSSLVRPPKVSITHEGILAACGLRNVASDVREGLGQDYRVIRLKSALPSPGADFSRMTPAPTASRPDALVASAVTLELLTPMRLVSDGALVKSLSFPVFMRRLLRRLTDLTRTATGGHPGFDHEALLALAEGVRVAEDRTRWVDVPSWSGRQGRFTPIGGLLGEITFEGDLAPFTPWMLWGTITHVGKDATKGGGWYGIQGSGFRVQGSGPGRGTRNREHGTR